MTVPESARRTVSGMAHVMMLLARGEPMLRSRTTPIRSLPSLVRDGITARSLLTSTALAGALVALVPVAFPTAALAACTLSGGTLTCEGNDIPEWNGNGAPNFPLPNAVVYQNVTGDIPNDGSSNGAFIWNYEGGISTNGVDADGTIPSLTVDVTLDQGHGFNDDMGVAYIDAAGKAGDSPSEYSTGDEGKTGRNAGSGEDGTAISYTVHEVNPDDAPDFALQQSGTNAQVGITMLSVGGSGGTGGEGHNTGFHDITGGDGGTGGAGGEIVFSVEAGNAVNVTTANSIPAIMLVSQGGNGGEGGYGHANTGVGTGGVGGTGGASGDVTVSLLGGGTVATSGGGSIPTAAIYAVSRGGDGGGGGKGEGGFKHGQGGEGGPGGASGDVALTIGASDSGADTTVTGSGDQTYGLALQSMSGAGGAGGSGDSPWTSSNGGAGAKSGAAGSVTANLYNTTVTTGDDSGAGVEADGILAQSIGGFGGAGGSASGIVAYGGDGFSGGDGGAVSITTGNGTSVTTYADHSSGLLAQSIGGGGGKAGSGTGIVGLGGSGGPGGEGGTVTLDLSDSTFTTHGVNAAAVRAMSIGGGGGAGGAAGGIVSLGGSGAAGGDGGPSGTDAVALTVDGLTATTSGDQSSGIEVMSVGGGGGSASSTVGLVDQGGSGAGGGSGRQVNLTSTGDGLNVTTAGTFADGVSLQSVGGGGGKGGSSFSLSVGGLSLGHTQGGTGGGGGAGGAVTYTGSASDTITTTGDNSAGVMAQSIGGGGGRSGNTMSIDVGADLNLDQGGVSQAASGGRSEQVDLHINGKSIDTSGDLAPGVVAQSIGGGGGSAGTSSNLTVGIEVGKQMGASGGQGGASGYAYVSSAAAITTQGHGSDGILAQSVGGGGGHSATILSFDDGLTLPGFVKQQGKSGSAGGGGGNSGTSVVDNQGVIVTNGDNAIGVVSQSIAGGGGRSGDTISGNIGIDLGGSTLGQSGGAGGVADFAHIENEGAITTGGHNSNALVAQSIGGGGGIGGTVIHGDVGLNFSTTHGADGGVGGTASNVQAFNHADLSTSGAQSTAIVAQSIGGGGGAGGLTVDGSISVANMSATLGSDGGPGGAADYAHTTNHATITTTGDMSHGILNQSIGGSGGQAGHVIQGDVSGGEVSGSVDVAVGGSGGAGGKAAFSHVENTGTITTAGHGAFGILAQSIGGDGGHGGSVYSGSINVSLESGVGSTTSIGGSGGAGGIAGDVTVENTGGDVDNASVTTSGDFAHAIAAQSVGGNGGVGGASYAGTFEVTSGDALDTTTAVGGSGGGGAIGGAVTVTNAETVATTGGNAYGILAQSVGGNGGAAGAGHAYFGSLSSEAESYFDVNATIGVGGAGGTGSNAGTVSVTNSGTITTGLDASGSVVEGSDTSYGILAQSIGAGGGDGGGAGATSGGYTSLPKDADGNEADAHGISLKVSIGGSGGASGDGDTVTVANEAGGSVATGGLASHAIFAQSIGGGGGSGGDGKPSDTGWIAKLEDDKDKLEKAKENYEKLKAYYKKLTGSEEQAEKKASAIKSHTIAVNGKDGAAGTGGAVSVTNEGTLSTQGGSAAGIFAQSIGGGGGASGAGSQGFADSLTVADAGSGGGNGGTVTIDKAGTITTSGDKAVGIFAQSVGGGGGAAGDVATVLGAGLTDLADVMGTGMVTDSSSTATVVGGDGGDVSVTIDGTLSTAGDYSHGVFAQSVGGAGGAMGDITAGDGTGRIGSDTGAGDSGAVSLTVDGSIDVKGDNAVGIFAQSVAGDDGSSYSGGIDITVNGSVTAGGSGGRAILAQVGESGTGSTDLSRVTNITIAKGATVSATSSDAAETIGIIGGHSETNGNGQLTTSNTVTNNGTLTAASPSVNVIHAMNGATVVQNNGTMVGSIVLSDSHVNTLTNSATGTMQLGENVNLGSQAGAAFVNEGSLSIGPSDVIASSRLVTDVFEIASGSTLPVDISSMKDGAGFYLVNYDYIYIQQPQASGPSAQVAADALDFNWVSAQGVQQGSSRNLPIINADNGVDLLVDGEVSTEPYTITTPTVVWTLSTDGDNLNASFDVDYAGTASGTPLSGTARDFGAHFGEQMTRLAEVGDTIPQSVRDTLEMAALEFLNIDSGAALETLYDELSPEEALLAAKRSVSAALSLHELVQSCPTITASDAERLFRQHDCVWAQGHGRYTRASSMDRSPSYKEGVGGFAFAAQKEIFDQTFLEVGAQYERVSLDGSNFQQQGNAYGVAAALKREMGIFTVSGTVAGGLSNFDYERYYSTGGRRYRAESDIDGQFVSVEGRVYATLQNDGGFYAKPSVALALVHNWQDGFREKGTGTYNWQVNAVEGTHVYLTPSLEVGRAFKVYDNPILAYVRAGVQTALTDPQHDMVANIVDGGASLAGLRTVLTGDRVLGEFSAGLKMDVGERLTFSLEGDTALSEHTTSFGGMARIDLRF